MTLTDDQIEEKLRTNPDTLSNVLMKNHSFMKTLDMDKAYQAFSDIYVKTTDGNVDLHGLFSTTLGIGRHEAKVLAFSIATDSAFIRRIMYDQVDQSNEVKTKNLTALYEPS